MRNLQVLKTLLLALLWLLVGNSIVHILITSISLFNGETSIPYLNEGALMTDLPPLEICFKIIGQFVFIYGILKLKKVVDQLAQLRIFDSIVIESLYVSGNAFIVGGALLKFIELMHYLAVPAISMWDILESYTPILFIITIGLFLKIMAVVIRIAKGYKEENELTI